MNQDGEYPGSKGCKTKVCASSRALEKCHTHVYKFAADKPTIPGPPPQTFRLCCENEKLFYGYLNLSNLQQPRKMASKDRRERDLEHIQGNLVLLVALDDRLELVGGGEGGQVLNQTGLSSQNIQSLVSVAHVADEAREGEGGVVAGEQAVLVNVADVQLHRGVVLGSDDLLGGRALAGNVRLSLRSHFKNREFCFITAT